MNQGKRKALHQKDSVPPQKKQKQKKPIEILILLSLRQGTFYLLRMEADSIEGFCGP